MSIFQKILLWLRLKFNLKFRVGRIYKFDNPPSVFKLPYAICVGEDKGRYHFHFYCTPSYGSHMLDSKPYVYGLNEPCRAATFSEIAAEWDKFVQTIKDGVEV